MSPHRTLAALVLSAALLGACGGGGSDDAAQDTTTTTADDSPTSAGAPVEIVAKSMKFTPESARAAVGQKVVWRFDDGAVPHNVDGEDPALKSKNLTSGTYEHTFTEAGTYKYVCNLHTGMDGEVVVK